ncbi:MAG TPA: hypothetical protein DDZ83_03940, partial [Nitrospinae bacterium]|nr:hypothetical protein [Nitrospinota bacterium]
MTGEFEAAGVDLRKRGKMIREQIEVIRKVWSTKTFDFDGEIHQLRSISCELETVQKPAPPIWISSNPHVGDLSEKILDAMARRVAGHADGWMTCSASPEEFALFWERVQSAAKEAGREEASIESAY